MNLIDIEAKKAVALHQQRLKAQKEFSKQFGIITPIRAVRFVFNELMLEKSIVEVCKMAEDVSKMQCMKDMKPISTTIGYFAACRPHTTSGEFDPIHYGFSVCSCKDPFNEDIGVLKALDTKWIKKDSANEPSDGSSTITSAFPWYFSKKMHVCVNDMDYPKVVVDFFPITPLEQWEDFSTRRSMKYFKGATIPNEILPF